jgi:hypothetical protein
LHGCAARCHGFECKPFVGKHDRGSAEGLNGRGYLSEPTMTLRNLELPAAFAWFESCDLLVQIQCFSHVAACNQIRCFVFQYSRIRSHWAER